MRHLVKSMCLLLIGCLATIAQTGGTRTSTNPEGNLAPIKRVVIKSEIAGIFQNPLKCDDKGNLYFQIYGENLSVIKKYSAEGARQAYFDGSSVPELHLMPPGGYFSIGSDGTVHQLADVRESADRYVVTFRQDGAFRSKAKLDPGFDWMPSQLAVFRSGTYLVAGIKIEADREGNTRTLPFTGIFTEDGKLIKQVTLKDDAEIERAAEAGDPNVVTPGHTLNISAVELGSAESARDGNIYLMRRMSPAIFYAISPGGEVQKRFTVDPGSPDFVPVAMHISENRIAIQFLDHQNHEIIAVTDLDGHPVAKYRNVDAVGLALSCYSQSQDRFTFLKTTDEGFLALDIAVPK